MDIRVGNGFDVHRFEPGNHVWLCGVKIPHDQGLNGHSDADVGLHAVTDAIYGALAMGDIGQHFPPSDPQWKGAASHIFLTHAAEMARDMGFTLTHVDCTLICELPKIGPHAGAMRAELARILRIDLARISVKATTSEKLGFTGRGEGIAAMATATLVKNGHIGENMIRAFNTFGYIGMMRPAPGTWGSLAAMGLAYLICLIGGPFLLLGMTCAVGGLGIWTIGQQITGQPDQDPSEVVIDEVAGQWIALLPVAFGGWHAGVALTALWPGWIAAFVLFRLFDIWKPGPVGWADARGGALGVMLDDVIAGVFAGLGVMLLAGIYHGLLT